MRRLGALTSLVDLRGPVGGGELTSGGLSRLSVFSSALGDLFCLSSTFVGVASLR